MDIKELNEIIFDPIVCVKCGYCKSTCPTYLATRDERFSPRGRLYLSYKIIKEKERMGFSDLIRVFHDIDTCSKCGECEKTCPMGLNPYLSFMRAKAKTLPGKFEVISAKLTTKSKLFFTLLFYFGSKIKKSSYKINLTKISFRQREKIENEEKSDTIFFPSCFGYTIFSQTKKKVESLMEDLGVKFKTAPQSFSCCGAPLLFSGSMEDFEKNKKELIRKIEEKSTNDLSTLLVLGPTCTYIMKKFYKELNEKFPKVKIKEASDFIIEKIREKEVKIHVGEKDSVGEKDGNVKNITTKRESNINPEENKKNEEENKKKSEIIVIHKPCHEKYSDAIDKKNFFKELGFNVEETEFPCCGFGGSMFFKYPKMSNQLLDLLSEKIKKEEDKKVLVISNSPGCILQISRKHETKHILDLIYERIIVANHQQK
jgi:Fe-S oxidoreductase